MNRPLAKFTADWLSLREPYDEHARDRRLIGSLASRRTEMTGPLDIVDLGAGRGALSRHLAPHIGGLQTWRLVDNDQAQLDAARVALRSWATQSETRAERLHLSVKDAELDVLTEPFDLAAGITQLDLKGIHLVAASALLDLVSAPWLAALAARCRNVGAMVYASLSVNGKIVWSPADGMDATAAAAVSLHQSRDKGFGPALGAHAPMQFSEFLGDLGYHVQTASSDWRLAPEDATLQHALLKGWHRAAAEAAPAYNADFAAWAGRRRELIDEGRSALTVGHADLFATL